MKKLLFSFAMLFACVAYSQVACNQSAYSAMHTFTAGTSVNTFTESTQTLLLCNNAVVWDTLSSGATGFCRVGVLKANSAYHVRSKGCGNLYVVNTSTVYIMAGSTVACNIILEPGATIVNQSTLTLNTSSCSAIVTPSANCSIATAVVENKLTSSKLNVYPNPANNNITIETISGSFNESEISVYNLLGAKVYSKSLLPSKKIQLELNGLESGVYYLSVNSSDIKEVRKIIIAR